MRRQRERRPTHRAAHSTLPVRGQQRSSRRDNETVFGRHGIRGPIPPRTTLPRTRLPHRGYLEFAPEPIETGSAANSFLNRFAYRRVILVARCSKPGTDPIVVALAMALDRFPRGSPKRLVTDSLQSDTKSAAIRTRWPAVASLAVNCGKARTARLRRIAYPILILGSPRCNRSSGRCAEINAAPGGV